MAYPGVVFIGICGPTASGKSTVAEKVAQSFGSVVAHIEADWFFKSTLPSCPNRHSCWEQPASVDSTKLSQELDRVAAALGPTVTNVPSLQVHGTKSKARSIDVPGLVGTPITARPVVVVVEGFLLFADPEVVKRLSHYVWLELSCNVGVVRRFLRDKPGHGPADDSNPQFSDFRKKHYEGHMFPHFLQYKPLQLGNVRAVGKTPGQVSADIDKDSVLAATLAHLRAEEVTPSGIAGPRPMYTPLGWPHDEANALVWVEPATQCGRWWLTGAGMQEVDLVRGTITHSIQFVGPNSFVLGRWGHVYMRDSATNIVLVSTAKDKGVTHVAVPNTHMCNTVGFPSGLLKQNPLPPGKFPTGWEMSAAVTPAPEWTGLWHWIGRRTGFEGSWKLVRDGSPGGWSMHEHKQKSDGNWTDRQWGAVAMTPDAFFFPDFGHFYLLDSVTCTVEVWNGHGLFYVAEKRIHGAGAPVGTAGAICVNPGCGKPTYNGKPGERCSRTCSAICSTPGCGKPTYNGKPGERCSRSCGPGAPICTTIGCGKPTYNGKVGERCSRTCGQGAGYVAGAICVTPGCGKPSWNGKPGGKCSRSCA